MLNHRIIQAYTFFNVELSQRYLDIKILHTMFVAE